MPQDEQRCMGGLRPWDDPIGDVTGPPLFRYAEEWWRISTAGQDNGHMLKPSHLRDALATAREERAKTMQAEDQWDKCSTNSIGQDGGS